MNQRSIRQGVASVFASMLNILPVIFWLCLIYSFDEIMGANLTVIALIIHEIGHLICIYIFTGKLYLPRGDITGLRLDKRKTNSYKYDLALYSSGITSNIIAAIIMLPFAKRYGDFATLFITINIATAISNLLPIEGYDGYRVITLIFSYYDVGKNWYIILEIIAFFFVFLMAVSSLFFVYTFGNGYWIMAIFMVETISKLKIWMKKSIF